MSIDRRLQLLERRLKTAREKKEASEARIKDIQLIDKICENIKENVSQLAERGENGDCLATAALAKAATNAVNQLNAIAKHQPKIVRALSEKVFGWPAIISHKRALGERNKELLRMLRLGKGGPYSDRQWQLGAPSTNAAIALFIAAQSLEAQGLLPPLTAETKRKWFDVGWGSWIQEGLIPEKDKTLRILGKSKAGKRPKYCKNLRSATRAANVRAEIKKRVWEAFDNVITPCAK